MVAGHFKNAAVGTFVDEGIAVFQALHIADIRAIEPIRVGWLREIRLIRRVAPFDIERHRVDLKDPRIVAPGIFHPVRRRRIGGAVPGPAAVIEDQNIARPRQSLGDHMRMVLADNPADVLQLRFAVVRAELPDDLAALFIDNGDNVGFARVPDNVVRMETRVAGVIPFVRSQRRHGVDVHPVPHPAAAGAHIGVITQRRTRRVVKTQLVEMIAAAPFPHHIALPVDLNNGVIKQQLIGNLFIHQVGVGQN